jgi:ABC-2 type transport system ATP-binding protein
MSILRFQGVEKSLPFGFWLRKKQVLKGVSLSVQQGEIYAFLGPNGAGKTTSIKCLLGLLFPDAGSVELFDQQGPTLAARRRIGYLPERPYFYPHLKGRELLEYFGRLFGMRGSDLRAKCDELLALVGLEDDGEKLAGQYSKGMLQRLGVAQALINDPDLVILDEPMSGLDPIGRREVKDLIMSVKERGATVFFSSHILSDAEALCDRVSLLVDGKLHMEATLDDLLDEKVHYWQVASEGIEPGALPGYTPVSVQGDLNFYKLQDESAVDVWVGAVRQAGGRVYRLTPHRATLEDYFLKTVQQARTETGDGEPAEPPGEAAGPEGGAT